MADNFDIQATIKGAFAGLSSWANAATQADKISGGIARAEKASANFAKSARESGAVAAGAWGGVAIAGGLLIGKGVMLAADFESQMSGAGAVLGTTGAQLTKLSDLALEMGKKTSFSASQAASGIEALGSMGMSTADILRGGLAGTLALAAATGVKDLGFAGETAATALNIFGLKGKDVAKVADVVAAAANSSALRVQDFAAALSTGGSTARRFKLGLTDFTSVLTLMADIGIKGAEAGTNIKSAFDNASGAAPKAKKLMDAMGFDIYTKAGGRKSLVDIVQNLEGATKKMTVAEKNYFLNQTFGSYGVATMNTLLEAGSQKLIDRKKQLDLSGAAEIAAKKRLDNLKGSQEQFMGSLETLGIVVGTAALPALRQLTDAATKATNDVLGLFGDAGNKAKIVAFFGGIQSGAEGAFGAISSAAQKAYALTKPVMDLIGGNKDPRNTRTGRGQDQLNASSMGSTIGIVAVSFGALAAGAFANKLLGGLPTKLAGGLAKGIWGMLKGTMTGGKGAGDLLSAATGARVFVTNWPGGGFGGGLPDVPSGAPGAGRAAGGLLEKGAGLLRNAGLIAAAGAVGYGIGTIIEQNLPKNVKTGMQGFLAKNLFGASKTSSQIAAETQADVAAIRARAAANRKLAAALKPNQYVNTAIKNADYSGVYKPAPIVPSKPAVVYRPAPVIPRGVTYGPPARAAPLPVRPIVKTPAVTQKFEIIIPSITGVDANVLAATLKTQLTQIALATAQRSAADTQRKLKAALDGANNGFENPKVYGPPSSLAGGG